MALKNRSKSIKQMIQSVAGLLAEPILHGRLVVNQLDYKSAADVAVLATGLRPLDKALGIGGLPYSHITELIGPGITPISGGSLCIAARIGAKVQRRQEIVSIIDMNQSFDTWQAERCGLIASHLLHTQPDTIFEALTAIENAARNAQLTIVIMGIVAQLLRHIEPHLLKTLQSRLQKIVKQSNSAFLFITHPLKTDPFEVKNYPPNFLLADIAAIQIWVQEENWTYKAGLSTAYKANVTIIKNELAIAGKGGNIRIKLNND